MSAQFNIRRVYYLCLCMLCIAPAGGVAQQAPRSNFLVFVENIQSQILSSSGRNYTPPTSEELQSWTRAFYYFRMNSLDSCKKILAQHNYALVQIADHRTGCVYDVFRENAPFRKGWGTFIYNRHHAKRLLIHVTHPADDGYVAQIGAELFQKTRAEWLYLAGTKKNDETDNVSLDVARTRESLLQRWHEIYTDLTHMTLSLHGFDKKYYRPPVTGADIVVSNGKTSDDQWGISQISLSYRDSLKNNGFACAVAMYDSGFAPLGWGVSPQGMFSNDSVGFGHWLNIELSREIRYNPAEYSRFIALTDRALEVTGRKVSEQVNRAFGLVSPRTLRLDAQHGLLFPPSSGETYRIVSFNSETTNGDTMNIRVGSWLRFPGSSQAMSSLDTSGEGILQKLRKANSAGTHSAIANIVEQESPAVLSSYLHFQKGDTKDSSAAEDGNASADEPMQVRRIPLHRQTSASSELFASSLTPFIWQGGFASPSMAFLQFGQEQSSLEEELPNFLIPIINRSLVHLESPLVGLRMSKSLVEQIAKLMHEQSEDSRDLQLLAEMTTDGDYYLRVVPAASPK